MKLKPSEKGFTLIELLVTISIVAVVVGAASMAIISIMRISPKNNDWAIALRQVQNAGYWISRDAQRAQNIHDNVAAPDFLVLTWTNWDYSAQGTSTYHAVTYKFEDMPDGVKRLMRRHQNSTGLNEQIMIAEYIYYEPGAEKTTKVIEYDGRRLKVRITATIGEAEKVSRDYEATRRPTF